MKFVSIALLLFFAVCSSINAETVNKGDYFAWVFARDSQAYVDGDFISWRTNESDDAYEFRQHFIWTDEEIDELLKKSTYMYDAKEYFYKQYNRNLTDEYYIKRNGKKYDNGTRIDISASVFELYYTCVRAGFDGETCATFYLNAYEASVKKFNAQASKTYKAYTTYGPLELPITSLVQQMFDHNKKICQAGTVTAATEGEIKVVERDSIALCSYSEKTEKYKCIMNRFYNTSYKCTVSCEGVFFTHDSDLLFDGNCSDQSIIPTSRPTIHSAYGMLSTFEDYNHYMKEYDKKLKDIDDRI